MNAQERDLERYRLCKIFRQKYGKELTEFETDSEKLFETVTPSYMYKARKLMMIRELNMRFSNPSSEETPNY